MTTVLITSAVITGPSELLFQQPANRENDRRCHEHQLRHSLKICRDYDNLVIHPLSEEDLVTTAALRLNKPLAATPLSMTFMPAARFRACAGLSCVPDYRLTPEHPFTATLISSAEVVAITIFARISQVFAAFTFLASRTSDPSVPFSCFCRSQMLDPTAFPLSHAAAKGFLTCAFESR